MADAIIEIVEQLTNTVEVFDPTAGMSYSNNTRNPFTAPSATEARILSVAVVEGMTHVQLIWTQSTALDHKHTEVWRAEINNLNAATKVGSSSTTAYTDAVSAGVTYYYWLRPISFNGQAGEYSEAHQATSGRNPEGFAAALGQALTAENMSESLAAAVDLIVSEKTDSALLALENNIQSLNLDFANVSNLASLVSLINTIKAELQAEDVQTRAQLAEQQQYMVTQETALAQQISQLSAVVDSEVSDREAAILAEREARANDLGVVAEDVVTLTASLTDEAAARTAAIENEQVARATAISTVTAALTSLESEVDTGFADLQGAISDEANLRINQDAVLAQTITDLTATLNTAISDLEASISSESTVRVNTVTALAQTVENYTTTIDGNSATLTTLAASVDGINAEYAVKTDVNGRVAGIGLVNTGDSSNFEIIADNFAVLDPDDPAKVVLGATNGAAFIDGAYIKSASIDSASIASLDAGKINADSLDAINANIGDITAGTLKGPNNRFQIDLNNNVLKVFDASGNLRVQLGAL